MYAYTLMYVWYYVSMQLYTIYNSRCINNIKWAFRLMVLRYTRSTKVPTPVHTPGNTEGESSRFAHNSGQIFAHPPLNPAGSGRDTVHKHNEMFLPRENSSAYRGQRMGLGRRRGPGVFLCYNKYISRG